MEFQGEIVLHVLGLTNIDKPAVFIFPRVIVCLACGEARFGIPQLELLTLALLTPTDPCADTKQS
jgi:hypothetical protein